MSSNPERALAAAVDLIGSQGIRALSHARVDQHAGLPRGSTSNYFRTRTALLEAVVLWISEQERADFDAGFDPGSATPAGFVELFSHLIEVQTDDFSVRTRARYALFLESVASPAVAEPLHAQRRVYEGWMRSVAVALGMPEPDQAALSLMACGEGLVLHRLSVDPDAPVRPTVERLVRGCLAWNAAPPPGSAPRLPPE